MKQSIYSFKLLLGSMELFEDMIHYFGTDKLYRHSNGQSLGVVNVIMADLSGMNDNKWWTVLVPWDMKNGSKGEDYVLRVPAGLNLLNIENEVLELTVKSR
jgi:hypothetical protein